MVAQFSARSLNLAVIQIYVLTAGEEIKNFYFQLRQALEKLPKKNIKMIMVDRNSKIGWDKTGYKAAMGRHR